MQLQESETRRGGEQGFMLVGVIVLLFLVLLALSVAAPKVAEALRRDREVEAIHRGNEYVMAIRRYYSKFGHYPGNMEQLEKSNNIRFLRQKYVDPMTGKADWRLIHVGEAKTTVKGFFGQPLAGLPGATAGGLGSAASLASAQPTATVGGSTSAPSTGPAGPGGGGPLGGSMPGSYGSPISGPTTSPATSGPGGAGSPGSTSGGIFGSSSGIGSQSATSFTGGGAPIVGVGSSKTGTSITELNEQTTYQTWEFLYDPRIEQMKAKAALLGGAPGTGFGSSPVGTPVGQPIGGSPGATTPGSSSPSSSPGTPASPQ